jgi:hypothetical protein
MRNAIYTPTGWEKLEHTLTAVQTFFKNIAHPRITRLTLSQLMLHICSVSKTFGEWYQKTVRRTAAIQQRVTAVLWSIPKEAFADSFQKLYERCQPCVVKDGFYFEGK